MLGSQELMQRKSEIESELERLGREVAYAEEVLHRFLQLDDARKADAEATRQLRNAESEQEQALTALSAAQNKQTGLASELERWQQVVSKKLRVTTSAQVCARQDKWRTPP
jgi:chromosome segregation ATPase